MYNKIKPISDFDEDLLDLKNYVNGVCTYIDQLFKYNENACVGIIGKWGDGKTSAINLCLKKLKENNKEYINWCSIFFVVVISLILISLIVINFKSINEWLNSHIDIFTPYFSSRLLNFILFSLLCVCLPFMHYKNVFCKSQRLLIKCWKYLFVKNQIIEIRYSPWDCSSKEQMVREYLKLLANELFLVVPSVAIKLIKYSKLISGIDLNPVLDFLGSEQDISTQKQEIISVLENADIKIIVIIDDLDRIHGNEVFNMLKLIGTIANFPKIINIVAYDKEYICNNLNKYFLEENCISIDNAEKYIQKIIPCDFPLPKIKHDTLFNIFMKELEDIVKEQPYNKKDLELYYVNTIGRYIHNIRDVKQLLLAFKFHYDIFYKKNVNINIVDLIFITSIKIFNFALWQKVYNCAHDIFECHRLFLDNLDDANKKRTYFENTLGLKNLLDNEKCMLSSLIPMLRDLDGFRVSIQDQYSYDIKRFWSNLSFNLYFEFNPKESKINEILGSLAIKNFKPNTFYYMLTSDVDWSDLGDIVYSNQYVSQLNKKAIFNFIDFLLHIDESQNKFSFIRLQGNLLKRIDDQEFNDIISTCLENSSTLNLDALFELIYMFVLHKEGVTHKDSIKPLEDINLNIFHDMLYRLKNIVIDKSIRDLSIASINYLCLGFGKIDNEFREIIQQKIYQDVYQLEGFELLDYMTHFIFKANEVINSMSILKEKDIFTDAIKELLKSKLLQIKNDNVSMDNPKYIFVFKENNLYIGDRSNYIPTHIVDLILDVYLK